MTVEELEEKPKTFLKFRANQKSPVLEVSNGDYSRVFKAEEQPFEIADEEEERLLRNTGHFVSDKDAENNAAEVEDVSAAPAAASENITDQGGVTAPASETELPASKGARISKGKTGSLQVMP